MSYVTFIIFIFCPVIFKFIHKVYKSIDITKRLECENLCITQQRIKKDVNICVINLLCCFFVIGICTNMFIEVYLHKVKYIKMFIQSFESQIKRNTLFFR